MTVLFSEMKIFIFSKTRQDIQDIFHVIVHKFKKLFIMGVFKSNESRDCTFCAFFF